MLSTLSSISLPPTAGNKCRSISLSKKRMRKRFKDNHSDAEHAGRIPRTNKRIPSPYQSHRRQARPILPSIYQAGMTARKLTATHISHVLVEKVINPCTTNWVASILFAPEKNGTFRFRVYSPRSYAVVVWDAYPFSGMEECIESLGEAQHFEHWTLRNHTDKKK